MKRDIIIILIVLILLGFTTVNYYKWNTTTKLLEQQFLHQHPAPHP